MHHMGGIEGYSLRTYASALLFSPNKSLIRQLFKHEEPDEFIIKPAMSDIWTACLQTLEGHGDGVTSVAFSHDSGRLALASYDRTVKVWDVGSGAYHDTVRTNRVVRRLSFDYTMSALHTDVGLLVLQNSDAATAGDITEPKPASCLDTKFTLDDT